MSHFLVAVITPKQPTQEELEAILQPWHEYECTGVKDQYVEFVDHTEEVEEAWVTETQERWRAPDGQLLSRYDPPAQNSPLHRRANAEEQQKLGQTLGSGSTQGISFQTIYPTDGSEPYALIFDPPADYVKVAIPISEVFPSMEAYAAEWHGYREVRDGRIGRLTNPNKKWDWWVIGGRYSDRLTFKAGDSGDQASVADLDLEAMRKTKVANTRKSIENGIAEAKLSREEGLALWKEAALLHEKTLAEWRASAEDQKGKAFHEYITALPEDHPVRKARDCGLLSNLGDWGVGVPDTEPDPFAWADAMPPLTTYALVKDGKWCEKGEMGWFGISSNEKPESDWRAFVADVLGSLKPTDWITMVDCHI